MRAVGYRTSLPITDPLALEDLELPAPVARPHDVVVRVAAVSVNPVDTKVRKNRKPAEGAPQVLGWDAVGVVAAVGAEARRFAVGDRVYYAGAIDRPGTNSELHAVDERIIARAPRTLDDAQAAALPLTSITAYELLFDRLRVAKGGGAGQTLLVTGGAGGVGSILIQLARQLTELRVVATASRPETRAWCLELGAHAVIDHGRGRGPEQTLAAQLRAAGLGEVDLVASLTETAQHYEQLIEALKPQGQLALIDDMDNLNAMKLKSKSISLHWELMFTRSLYQTPDLAEQGALLAEVAELVDAGKLRTTATASFGRINAENLRRAHAQIESGTSRGKLVLAGW
jgi:zinc-binding alcohol dehydrogenase family protein